MFAYNVKTLDFDLVTVSETWLSSDTDSAFLDINGYRMFRRDRLGRGGGVMIYVKKQYHSNVIDLDIPETTHLEYLFIRVKINSDVYTIGTFYRKPSANIEWVTDFEAVLATAFIISEKLIVLGDFNCNYLKPDSAETKRFENILRAFDLSQIIREPTRITEKTSSLIDLICVDKSEKVIESGTLDPIVSADHLIVYAKISVSSIAHGAPPTPVTKRDFSSMVLEDFNFTADSINWDAVNTFIDVDDKLGCLNEQINFLFDSHAPLREYTTHKRNRPPFITYPIQIMIKEKQKLFKKYKLSKSKNVYASYKRMKNLLKFSLQEEKKAYFKYQILQRQKNPKQLWRFFNEHNVHKRSKNNISGKISDASLLNEYFLSTSNGISANEKTVDYFNEMHNDRFNGGMVFSPISEDECLKHLRSLKSNAYGCDGINIFMLGLLPFAAVRAITHIINHSMEKGEFPVLWKLSVVTPLAKVNEAEELSQLRPINITCALSKVCERVVFAQLQRYVEQNNILPDAQSGFRAQHSTASTLLKITSDISRSTDNNNVTILVSLDYSKAFERVDHRLLLAKLKYIGLSDKCISWIKSYLVGRYQCVKLKGKSSNFLEVKKGVPQGTILGPLLFTLYTFDIDTCVRQPCQLQLYADDTQIYVEASPENINEAIHKLNIALNAITEWSNDNGLLLNEGKSQAVCFGSRAVCGRAVVARSADIIVNGSPVLLTDEIKSLGVYLDRSLTFERQVAIKVARGFGTLRTLNAFKRLLPGTVKFNLVNSLIISQIRYCLVVFYNYLSVALKRKLQFLQNCCFRYSYVVPKFNHITPFYINHNILKIEYLALENQLSFVYKILKTKAPVYLYNLLTFNNSGRDMRRTVALLPRVKCTSGKNSFEYTIAALYNEYYAFILNSNNLNMFKKELKIILLDKQKRDFGIQ